MFLKYLFLLLIVSYPSFCLGVHSNGFITLKEHIDQGKNSVNTLLHEEDSNQFVAIFQNGIVVNEGAIVTQDEKIFKDTEIYHEDPYKLLDNKSARVNQNVIYFKGKLAVISSVGQENWYHWLFQVLPRIKILVDSQVDYDKIYINNVRFSWQKESLAIVMDLFNLPKECLLLTSGDCTVQASTLIVPSVPFIPCKSPVFPSWLKTFIRSTFLLKKEVSTLPKRIYISRSNASLRRISNEEEVTKALIENGFAVVHLEELSVYEQAELFSNAEIIIGPHGSGFSNLIFSQPKTYVIEIDHGLFGEEQRSFYKRMAAIMGCHYLPYYADFVEEEDLEKDINVTISDFLHFCKKAGLFSNKNVLTLN